MTVTMPVAEAAGRLDDLIRGLCPGDELTLTRDGVPVATLVVLLLPSGHRQFGRGRGKLVINPDVDDDEHLKDFENYL